MNESTILLSEMVDGQEADLFVMMSAKEEATTKNGKPYYRVGFRDAAREVSFPIWSDSAWAADCKQKWEAGEFYEIRAIYK